MTEDSTAAQGPAAQPTDPRRRLRELLAIPERDRTDAQWDELNELEIQFAPGNRVSAGNGPVPSRKDATFSGGAKPPQGPGKKRPQGRRSRPKKPTP